MTEKKLVITGLGAVTPLGTGADKYWESLVAGVCGIGEIRGIDTSALPIHRAGEVRDFEPRDYMSKPLMLDTVPFARFAYAAAVQAVEQSGLSVSSDRVAVVMGTALHGMDYLARAQQEYDEGGKGGDPKLMTKYMGNLAAAQFATTMAFRAPASPWAPPAPPGATPSPRRPCCCSPAWRTRRWSWRGKPPSVPRPF